MHNENGNVLVVFRNSMELKGLSGCSRGDGSSKRNRDFL